MSEIRVLEANEYDLLKDTPGGEFFTPENSIVLIAEDNGKVIARCAIMNVVHAEGTWIQEGRRNGIMLPKLEQALLGKARAVGLKFIHMYASDAMQESVLQRLDWTRLPLSIWAKEL